MCIRDRYDTDGSVGAAKGAGIGVGIYKDNNEAFATLEKLEVIEPKVACLLYTSMAVFTRQADAPISIASAAWLGAPIPASTTKMCIRDRVYG